MLSVVVGVAGGSGGTGASTFAAALATAVRGRSTLVDLDPVGGGLDVLLGIETVPGARWSGLRVDVGAVGGGSIEPATLDAGLPHLGAVGVLAADVAPPAAALVPVLEAAIQLGPVILDVGRTPTPLRDEALRCCDVVLVVAAGSVVGLTAARRVLATLPAVPVGVVLRRGAVGRRDAGELLGVPVLGALPEVLRGGGGGVPAGWVRVATAVLDGLLEQAP